MNDPTPGVIHRISTGCPTTYTQAKTTPKIRAKTSPKTALVIKPKGTKTVKLIVIFVVIYAVRFVCVV